MTSTSVSEPFLARLRPYRWQLAMLFIGVLIPLCLFGALAEEVAEKEGFFFDLPILLFVHSYATPLFDQIMLFCTRAGSSWSLCPIDVGVFLVLLGRRRWAKARFWGLAVAGPTLLALAAKYSFARVRPHLWVSLAPETTFGFPSGHSVGSMAFALALIVLTWRTRWRWPVVVCASLFVFLVGLSRIYLGVHYPSDVFAGWAISLAWVLGLTVVFHRHWALPNPGFAAK